ncbi:unnamed protein product, partial [Musa textilis]
SSSSLASSPPPPSPRSTTLLPASGLLRSNSGTLPSSERCPAPSQHQALRPHRGIGPPSVFRGRRQDDGDRALALRFFVWAGLQPNHRHSAAAYVAACDALHLPRHPLLPVPTLDSYRAAFPVCVKTFKILLNLCRHGNLPDEAIAILRRMPEFNCCPDNSSYNAVLRLLADAGRGRAVPALLEEMTEAGLIPDAITYVSAVRGLSASGQIGAARGLHGQMRANGCVPNVVVYSALLDGACACGDLKSAMELLVEMERELEATCAPNVVTYTCLIKCLCEKGQLGDALGILDRMEQRGCSPNQVTVRTLVDGFCAQGHVNGAHELIERAAGEGAVSTADCYSVLVVCLLRIQDMEGAEKVLGRMVEKGDRPSGLACNALMRELCERRRFVDTCRVLEMEEKGLVCIDSDVYSRLLLGFFCEEGHLNEALRLAAKVVERETPLQADCVDGVVEVLSESGEHALAAHIMRLKQP